MCIYIYTHGYMSTGRGYLADREAVSFLRNPLGTFRADWVKASPLRVPDGKLEKTRLGLSGVWGEGSCCCSSGSSRSSRSSSSSPSRVSGSGRLAVVVVEIMLLCVIVVIVIVHVRVYHSPST